MDITPAKLVYVTVQEVFCHSAILLLSCPYIADNAILKVCRRNGSQNSFNTCWRIQHRTSRFLDQMKEAIWVLLFSFWSFGKGREGSSEYTHLYDGSHSERDLQQLWLVRNRCHEVWPSLQMLSGGLYQMPQPNLWMNKIQPAVATTGREYWCLHHSYHFIPSQSTASTALYRSKWFTICSLWDFSIPTCQKDCS